MKETEAVRICASSNILFVQIGCWIRGYWIMHSLKCSLDPTQQMLRMTVLGSQITQTLLLQAMRKMLLGGISAGPLFCIVPVAVLQWY